MSVLVVGVNHRTAPLDLLERIALDAQSVAKAVSGLVALDSVREAVILSTCNRTEVYAVAELFHQGFDDIQHFLATTAGVDLETINSHTYAEHDDAADITSFRWLPGSTQWCLAKAKYSVKSEMPGKSHRQRGSTFNS